MFAKSAKTAKKKTKKILKSIVKNALETFGILLFFVGNQQIDYCAKFSSSKKIMKIREIPSSDNFSMTFAIFFFFVTSRKTFFHLKMCVRFSFSYLSSSVVTKPNLVGYIYPDILSIDKIVVSLSYLDKFQSSLTSKTEITANVLFFFTYF